MGDAVKETPRPDPERLKRSHGTEAPLAGADGPAPQGGPEISAESEPQGAKELQLRRLPLVPLRDDVIFPKLIVPLSVGRRTSIAAITFAMDHDKQVLLGAQKDPQVDDTAEQDLYAIGTVAEINGMRQTPAGVQML